MQYKEKRDEVRVVLYQSNVEWLKFELLSSLISAPTNFEAWGCLKSYFEARPIWGHVRRSHITITSIQTTNLKPYK